VRRTSRPYRPRWLEGDGTSIAQARHLAARFLTQVQAEHSLPVSQRAVDVTQLVVSELVTNARKYAPGPALMDLRIVGDLVEIVVWDSAPVLPVARATDAGRVGQHGMEICRC
jgi:anti-sigma regulatory factor (Ser/Thr protein kinase)